MADLAAGDIVEAFGFGLGAACPGLELVDGIGGGGEEPAGWTEEDGGGVESEVAEGLAALAVGDEFWFEVADGEVGGVVGEAEVLADEFEEVEAGAGFGEGAAAVVGDKSDERLDEAVAG